MDDLVLIYFSENLATVSKEELLKALKNALEVQTAGGRLAFLGPHLFKPEAKER